MFKFRPERRGNMLNKKTLEGIKQDAMEEAVKWKSQRADMKANEWFALAAAAETIINTMENDERKKK